MNNKFKVGDTIIYTNKGRRCTPISNRDLYRLQLIINMDKVKPGRVQTKFLDTGEMNYFDINTPYYKECELYTGQVIKEYDNGIPLIW